MNKHKSLKSAQSLLERASDLYGFENSMRAKPAEQDDRKVVQPKADDIKEDKQAETINDRTVDTEKKAVSNAAAINEAKTIADNSAPLQTKVEITDNEPTFGGSLGKGEAVVKAPSFVSKVEAAPDEYYNNQSVRKISRQWLADHNLLIPNGPVTALSEEFRIVKRQLLLAARGGKGVEAVEHGERILICSANPNEGKTYTSINLALSMASEKDNRVLLIDADFAKPSILSTLNIEGGPGLMDALADPSLDVKKMVLETDVDGLSVLPAGSQSNQDTEYLAAARTAKIIEKLSQDDPNRIIIFDSPPALAASPASVLALHVGQTLMVVHADKTTDSALRDALNLLSGCDHVQLLLNRANFSPSGRKFGSYYGYGA